MKNPLSEKMRALAFTDTEHAPTLNNLADELDGAAAVYMAGSNDPRRLLGVWAKARRLYCQITGEPFV